MINCYQFEGMNMLDHGNDVHDWFLDLDAYWRGDKLEHTWKLPDWINDSGLISNIMYFDIVKLYQIYHDCGKPFCRVVDENGKQHFPDHASVSKRIWLSNNDLDNDNISMVSLSVAELIGMDMDVHTIRGEEINEFIQRPEAATLLVTGLCEIHSNAIASGYGIDSTSFKIKWKQIDKIGKRYCKCSF